MKLTSRAKGRPLYSPTGWFRARRYGFLPLESCLPPRAEATPLFLMERALLPLSISTFPRPREGVISSALSPRATQPSTLEGGPQEGLGGHWWSEFPTQAPAMIPEHGWLPIFIQQVLIKGLCVPAIEDIKMRRYGSP